MSQDIAIVNEPRQSIDMNELRYLMAWSWGERGLWIADKWEELNNKCWGGALLPVPIWFPSSPPYGHWLGQYTGGPDRTSHHIQIKRGLNNQGVANVLLHEMIHQHLYEAGLNSRHNSKEWCAEIMRLTRLIWGREIYAAPSLPRKVEGKSARVQKPGPNGEKSLPLSLISSWPDSIKLNVPI